MLLAIDVGNSETVLGLFEGERLRHQWRVTSFPRCTGDELFALLHALLASVDRTPAVVTGIAVCSVVPELSSAYRSLGQRLHGEDPLLVGHETVPDLPILNLDPASVGADRLANAVGVRRAYGSPAIVVDLGTATTFDVVSAKGEYVGGVIAPGVLTSAQALFQRGARLPRVEVRPPLRVVGRTTEESMQAGIFLSAVGGIDSLVRAIVEEQGFPPGLPVVATGGLAGSISEASKTITAVDAALTLNGVRLVWEGQEGKGV